MANEKPYAVQTPGVTTEMSPASIINTINPLSPIARIFQPKGFGDYVPQWLINLFGGGRGAQQAAHITSKVVGGGLATAATVAAIRSLAHIMQLDKLNKANLTPADKLQKIYSNEPRKLLYDPKKRVKDPSKTEKDPQKQLQKKRRKKQLNMLMNKQANAGYNIMAGTIPLATAAIAAIATGYATDKIFDTVQQKHVQNRTQQAQDELNELILARARLARMGKKPAQDILNKKSSYTGLRKKALGRLSTDLAQSVALLATFITAAAATAGFMYQRNTDQNNTKFKAYKKGLQQYVKQKQRQAPARTMPIDPDIIKSLDKDLDTQQNKAVEISSSYNPARSIDI